MSKVDPVQASKDLYMMLREAKLLSTQIEKNATALLLAHQSDDTLVTRVSQQHIRKTVDQMKDVNVALEDLVGRIYTP